MNDLSRIFNIADLRRLARRRLPRMVFDYIDGGAEDEIALRANNRRFQDYQLTWDALQDISTIRIATTVLGSPSRLPFVICPTATSRLFNPVAGERAVAKAAAAAGMIYSLSTLASTTVEDIAAVNAGPKWFQIYVWKDRGLVREAGVAHAITILADELRRDLALMGCADVRALRRDSVIAPRR